jgi:hypothetical protein
MGNISVMLATEIFRMRRQLLTPSLAKPRKSGEAILKGYEMFIFGDVRSVINSFHANFINIGTP